MEKVNVIHRARSAAGAFRTSTPIQIIPSDWLKRVEAHRLR